LRLWNYDFKNRVEYTTASSRIVQRATCEYNLANISEKLNKVLYYLKFITETTHF